MELSQDRNDIIKMLNQIQNADLISKIKEVITDLMPKDGFQLNEGHKRILDERIDKYRRGEGKTYSWEEVLKEVKGG